MKTIKKKQLKKLVEKEVKKQLKERLTSTGESKTLYTEHQFENGIITIDQYLQTPQDVPAESTETITMTVQDTTKREDVRFEFTVEEFKKFQREISNLNIKSME